MEFAYLSLNEASDLIARGEISPRELTAAFLQRIDRFDPPINSYLTVLPELALEQARVSEEEIRQGSWRGPLHGIPIALKDLYDTQGIRTCAGSRFFENRIPEEDAAVVQKLRQAGAVLLGKLNMHEIALGVTNQNPHYGDCKNPWDLNRITGGSSGGSGAALAAGLCMGSLGSDTGGSIRIPSSLCGVVGLKPTFGRVSLRGVIPLSWNLDHAGPMARCVRDVALLLSAIAGFDPGDPASTDVPVSDYLSDIEKGVQGWRVALASDEFFVRAEPDVLEAVRAAAQVFEQLGAQVEEVSFPEGYQAAQANGRMVVSDAAAFHRERLSNQPDIFGPDVLQRLSSGLETTSTDYILARRTQTRLRRWYEQFFTDYDVLLLPATPVTAPLLSGSDAVEKAGQLTRFTAPFNLTGLPAISLPCGFTPDGLPIGLQIVTRPWAEAAVLRAAYAYEQATAWRQRHPELFLETS